MKKPEIFMFKMLKFYILFLKQFYFVRKTTDDIKTILYTKGDNSCEYMKKEINDVTKNYKDR